MSATHFVLFPQRTDAIRAATGRLYLADAGTSVELPPALTPHWTLEADTTDADLAHFSITVHINGKPVHRLHDCCPHAQFDATLDELLTVMYLGALLHAARTIRVNTAHGLKPLCEVSMEART